ncbi:MAG: GspH/FimT family pseudopilin [Methylophaga sp.]|nr:GspH/FimT family pseudopilin [Methylophaga sp.]
MNRNGFTVIELMIVLSVLAIISATALPSFRSLLIEIEVDGQINKLVSTLQLARSEAVKHNQVVTICKSLDGQNCGGNWSDGWLMFVDNNADGHKNTAEIALTSAQLIDGYTLSWSAFGSNNYIRFRQNGLTSSHNGSFILCPVNLDSRFARAVIISKTSRVRTSKDSDQDGVEENASGDPLSC